MTVAIRHMRQLLILSYYQGLQGVLKEDFFINYKNSQLLLGIRYTLTQEKDKELNKSK